MWNLLCHILLSLPTFAVIGIGLTCIPILNSLLNRRSTVRWLQRKMASDPNNPRWPAALGFWYQCASTRAQGAARLEAARLSLGYYERWLALAPPSDLNQDYSRLQDLARVALEADAPEKARQYATQLLKIAAHHREKTFGNFVHRGHSILGRLALRDGDVEAAKRHLIQAAQAPRSPQLDSYGPRMILAHELLALGEQQIVLDYMETCRKFCATSGLGGRLESWTNEKRKAELTRWITDVSQGRTPDFGRSLGR